MRSFTSKLLSLFKFQRIRSRVLFAMIVISVPPLFLLGFVSFNTAKDSLMKTNTKTNEDHLMTSSEVADMLFKNIINLNQAMVMDEAIRNDLRSSISISDEEQNVLRRTIQSRIQKVMNNNFLDSRYVDSVCLYNMNFDAYCIGRTDDAGQYEGVDKKQVIPDEEWYQMADEAKGRVVFLGRVVLENNDHSFSSVKLYRDAGSIEGRPIGVLIVNISSSVFDRVFCRG